MASSPYIHILQAGPTACRQTDLPASNPASSPHVGFILTQWPERTFTMEVGSCQSTLIMLRCLHFPQRRAQAWPCHSPFHLSHPNHGHSQAHQACSCLRADGFVCLKYCYSWIASCAHCTSFKPLLQCYFLEAATLFKIPSPVCHGSTSLPRSIFFFLLSSKALLTFKDPI